MTSIKYAVSCCAVLSLLVGCTDKKTSQRALSAQEYLANSIKMEAGKHKGQVFILD